MIAPYVGRETIAKLDAFYEAHIGLCGKFSAATVIHGDLTEDHILLDPRRGSIAGVIDFADAAIGDPAQDFAFLWSYGDWVAKCAVDHYARADGSLLERSRRHYLKYAAHRIYYCMTHAKPASAARVIKTLRRQLNAIN